MMSVRYLIVCYLLNSVYASMENHFIYDYFIYKNITRVISFSCNSVEDDMILLKNFNLVGTAGIVKKLNQDFNIYLLRNTFFSKLGIFLDTRCYDEEALISLLFEASDYRMYDELYFWLILGSDLSNVVQLLDDRSFGISTDFVIAVPSDASNYQLYDVYNVFKDRGTALNITSFGTWNKTDGINVSLKQPKLARRSNLHRLALKAVFFKSVFKPNQVNLEEYLTNYTGQYNVDAVNKFSFQLLKHLSEMFNFTLESIEVPNPTPDDTINPLLHTIMNNSADLTGTTVTMNTQRTYMVKFIHQDWPHRTFFIFRNPQPTNIKLHEILEPFAKGAWIALFLLLITCIIIFTLFLYCDGTDGNIVLFSNSLIIIIGSSVQQGTNMEITRTSTRIAFLFILICGLLVYNFYTACVVTDRLDNQIYKINDSLIEFGKLKLRMSSEWIACLESFFKSVDWELRTFYDKYWSKIERENVPADVGIKLVKNGGFAYHGYPETIYPYINAHYANREICELMEVHVVRPVFGSFGAHVNSTIVELFRVGLTKISEVGLRNRQLIRWQPKKPKCRKDILTALSINIYEFSPHLLLLMIGFILAMIIHVFEFLIVNQPMFF